MNPTVLSIITERLKADGFDGLCHPPTDCACGLDDLLGPCEGAQRDCRAAYKIKTPGGETWFTVAFDHRPTEKEVEDYWMRIEGVERC